ncbi:sodium:phosphate symporter [Youhaiella tibetensis]|uniref:Na/Pi cotransporter family protein n=1 Tax=Paradevosia tibetensis TaxID=1447062 RepID=A0A5B9DKI3_9HYPH|nr:Na/Pi cotransporter family protein [Youhaiella tibetensis]QEE19576.1 Na/Pi cotransporter family protein [Youhaiella tibetensis]GGF31861.1 sodium:phosphate symporter [Youhaiella tibetensis]
MESTVVLIDILGAGALLIWGLRMVKTGVTRAFGVQLRLWIGRGTSNRVVSFCAGLFATLLLQSSTATAMMTASFASRQLLTGAMGQAVMLGANVGTSLVAGVLALDVHWLAPLFVLAGVATFKLNEGSKGKGIGRALLGLGLMLVALRLLGEATDPIRESTTIALILNALSGAPLFALILSAGLAVLASSSLAVVLLVMSLASAGTMDHGLALVLVAGANLGGAVPPLLATMGEGVLARRVTVSNLCVRACGSLCVLVAAGALAPPLAGLMADPASFVVGAHIGFNIALALIFLPLVGPLSRLFARLMPEVATGQGVGPRFLDNAGLEDPVVALSTAARETLRIGDTVIEMLETSLNTLRSNDAKGCASVKLLDDKVDALQEAVKIYLARFTSGDIEDAEMRRATEILSYAINLEHIGDIVDHGLNDLASRKIKGHLAFSGEGFHEIEAFYEKTVANLRIAQTIFMSRDLELARRLVEVKVDMRRLEQESAARHLDRIRQRRAESIETSTLHLDILRDLKRVNAHITSVAYPILDEAGQLRESRLRSLDKKAS